MSTETEAAVILQALPGIGAIGLTRLVSQFGTFEQILKASSSQLSGTYRKALREYQASPDQYRAIALQTIETCASNGIAIITGQDPRYPPLLKEIDSPPAVIYVKGDTSLLSLPQIALVGSRQHSATGEANAGAFARSLSASGFVITSGMALGIDAAAHHGAMRSGQTVAVLGTGIDVIYPRRHSDLYRKIVASGGAVVTEFPPGTPARAGNFPQRNRIISGLSLGVLVIEAAVQSGSLITARLALNQGREVFAIPGSIHNPLAKGCHRLIREGATLVETAQDIIDELSGILSFVVAKEDAAPNLELSQHVELEPVAARVLANLGFDYIDLDSLVARCDLAASELTGILISLELHGLVDSRAGLYCRIS